MSLFFCIILKINRESTHKERRNIMKFYEFKDLRELLKEGNETQIEEAVINIAKTVRAFVADTNLFLKEFGLHIVFEIDNSISVPFAVKGDNTTTILVNPTHLAYGEKEHWNTVDDLELPLAKAIAELLVTYSFTIKKDKSGTWKNSNPMSLNLETLKATTPVEFSLKDFYIEMFTQDAKREIKSGLIKKLNQQSDYLKYCFLTELFYYVPFDTEDKFYKLNQLTSEINFPIEAIKDFNNIPEKHKPEVPVIYTGKKFSDGSKEIISPIDKMKDKYSIIEMAFK